MIYLGTHYEYPFGGMAVRPEWQPKGRNDWEKDLDYICDTGFNAIRIRIGMDSNLDEVEELIETIHSRGLKIIFGFATFYVSDWFVEKYPDSKIVDPFGHKVPENAKDLRWQRACIDHPTYREIRNEILEQCAERFSQHPSIVAWCVHNEPSAGPVDNPCFCNNTLSKYRAKLKKQFGSLKELNSAFGTNFSTFDSILPPAKFEAENEVFFIHWKEFMANNLNEFLLEGRDIIKKHSPDALITQNGVSPYTIGVNSYDWWTSREYNLVSQSLYFAPNEYAVGNQSVIEMMKAMSTEGRHWITEFQGGPFPLVKGLYSGRDAEIQLNSALSHGIGGLFFYRWEALLSGAEPMINGMVEPDNYDTDRRLGVKKAIAELKPYLDILDEGQSLIPDVGIYFNRNQAIHITDKKKVEKVEKTISGAYGLLSDLGYETGFVMDEFAAECRYKTMLFPYTHQILSELNNIEEYIKNGGSAIIELPVEDFEQAKKIANRFGVEVRSHEKLIYLLESGWDLRGVDNDVNIREFNGYAFDERLELENINSALVYGDNNKTAAIIPAEYGGRLLITGFSLSWSYGYSLHYKLRQFINKFIQQVITPSVYLEGVEEEFRPLVEARFICTNDKGVLFVMNRSHKDYSITVDVKGWGKISCDIQQYSVFKTIIEKDQK